MLTLIGFLIAVAVVAPSNAGADTSLDAWISNEKLIASYQLLQNIGPFDGALGAVIASPSRVSPNYYFHWTRDAALVMSQVLDRGLGSSDSLLWAYTEFSKLNQETDNYSGPSYGLGLGEPKFHVNGSPFLEGWGRPQNDGPALRALVLTRFAKHLVALGQRARVPHLLYRAELPARSVIKADLEFVASEWRKPGFDLWEEVSGHHFYTRLVQLSALNEGAGLARQLGDPFAADWYERQAAEILPSLEDFWSPSRGYILATLPVDGETSFKSSQLDVAVILGVLHAGLSQGAWSETDYRVMATARALEDVFARIYPVNYGHPIATMVLHGLAPAMGRYPEDRYDGVATGSEGNPWFIATHALGEYCFRLVSRLREGATLSVEARAELSSWLGTTNFEEALIQRANGYIRRSRYHTNQQGRQSEQINRYHGYMQGAEDLTWSYASFLSLEAARRRVLSTQPK